ncbi:hypothetical protein GWI33_014715 [Rhynchophorus ferrugineus]|uniref:ADAM10 cysteine-rich domain-containing protein n=1 Tax=Rhynchophorus ferrugineus TaxID=354439 RepID=A0A834M6M4_RHYFE|nr:hypothetical protein GWI33_014715 [Rhynchophorus ferrugineus]
MDKKKFRVLIKYCFLKGKNTVKAKTWLDVDFSDTAQGKSTIKDLYAKFRRGEMSTQEDDDTATVHGIITKDGLFDGTIITKSDEFHIEPISRYFNESTTREPTFHSIVYRISDVKDPRNGHHCASQRFYEQNYLENGLHHPHFREKRWLLQGMAKQPYHDDLVFLNRSKRPFMTSFDINHQQIDEELETGNRTHVDASALVFKNVYKRASTDPKKTTCMLYLQADHQFFQKYGTEEACIEVMTRHVQRGPCCTFDCQVKFGDKCRDDNGCRDESFCNGREAQCPPSVNKPNKTICNTEFVCFMGECTGSICLAYGLESCQCIPKKGDLKTKACELCCKLPGDNQPCISSFEWNDMPYDVPDMYSKPGTPCNDYSGYCDVFQMCREVDPSGPLATLRKLLLSEESIASFKKWIIQYWYVVGVILSGIIALLVLCTKYLGKRPNLKLKSITIMHKQTTEAVRLPDNQDGVIIHQGVRTKVPLKKRVRDGKIKKKPRKSGGKINNKSNSANTNNNNKDTSNNLNSPKKNSPRKKKRMSAVVGIEENNRKKDLLEVPHSKVKKLPNKTKKKKKKEIIDYSSIQPDIDGKNDTSPVVHNTMEEESTDPVGKVHHWLKNQYNLPKSKSTPVGLTTGRGLHKKAPQRTTRPEKKSRSVANIPGEKDKVRVQVVYKPPFKFSLKLRKPEKNQTSVVIEPVKKSNARPAILVQSEMIKTPETPVVIKPTVPAPYDTINLASADVDSNIHTVQSDLEILLSENEYVSVDEQ